MKGAARTSVKSHNSFQDQQFSIRDQRNIKSSRSLPAVALFNTELSTSLNLISPTEKTLSDCHLPEVVLVLVTSSPWSPQAPAFCLDFASID